MLCKRKKEIKRVKYENEYIKDKYFKALSEIDYISSELENLKKYEKYFLNLKKFIDLSNSNQDYKQIIIKNIFKHNKKEYCLILEDNKKYFKTVQISIYDLELRDCIGDITLELKERNSAYILNVDSKEKGLGSTLIQEGIQWCKENNIKIIYGKIWDKSNKKLNDQLFYFYRKNKFIVNEENFTFKKEL